MLEMLAADTFFFCRNPECGDGCTYSILSGVKINLFEHFMPQIKG